MKRRVFIENLIKLGLSYSFVSSSLYSCYDGIEISSANDIFQNIPNVKKNGISVAIIGGGVSGLIAQFILKKKGVIVTLIEKKGRIGGRILSLTNSKTKNFFELGCLRVNEIYNDFITHVSESNSIFFKPVSINFSYVIDNKMYNEQDIIKTKELSNFFSFKNSLTNTNKNDFLGKTIKEVVGLENFDKTNRKVINSFINFFGGSIENTGYSELKNKILNNKNILTREFIIDEEFKKIIIDTLKEKNSQEELINKEINLISVENNKIKIEEKTYDYLIISSGVNSLKEKIKFNTKIDNNKLNSLNNIKTFRGMVFCIKVGNIFWSKETKYLLGTKQFSYCYFNDENSKTKDIIEVYLYEDNINYFETIEVLKSKIIDEIDLLFNNKLKYNIKEIYIKDWGRDEEIKHIKSFPSVGSDVSRRELSEGEFLPNVFLSGEEFSEYKYGTLEGALETGIKTSIKVIDKINLLQ